MVARITIPHRLLDALNYNENKVHKGSAECIGAGNYLRSHDKLNFYQKLEGFERLNRLNDRATTKTLHVSLNFDPSENLSKEKLVSIAETYMQKIGFGGQPYLVYRHSDAGHPHIHVVASTIREDGTRINTHQIGRLVSEPARKEIEQVYGLIRAENQGRLQHDAIRPVDAQKVEYGRSETKRGISNVLGKVIDRYRYTSLAELNAILKQYNVVADRGSEDGRIYKMRGLVYRVLDADGKKTGVPIKASAINGKPTLEKLEQRFSSGEAGRQPFRQKLKNSVDELLPSVSGIKQLVAALALQNVYTVLRQNAEGLLYGITFVDNRTRCVFNGSDLGKGYSVAGLTARLAGDVPKIGPETPQAAIDDGPAGSSAGSIRQDSNQPVKQQRQEQTAQQQDSLEELLNMQPAYASTPYELLKKKRKKKKKRDQGM